MTRLFRREIVEAQRIRNLGVISLSQPAGLWAIGVASAVVAAAVISFVAIADYTRRSRVMGELIPDLGLATVVASSPGVIGTLHAEEGDAVEDGSALAIVHTPKITASGNSAHVVMRASLGAERKSTEHFQVAQDRRIVAQLTGTSRQRDAAFLELEQIEKELQTRREQVQIAQSITDRYRRVAVERYVSLVQLSQQEQAVLEHLNAKQSLERQATSLKRTIAELDQRMNELDHERASSRAEASRNLATLERETVEVESAEALLLRTPVAGSISSRLVEPGQSVLAGEALYTVLPRGSLLRAQLMVPSSAIGFVKPQDRVVLRYQSFPYQKFGTHSGRVLRISRSTVSSFREGNGSNDASYRVIVELDSQHVNAYGREEALKPGMRLEADIMGERRRLYEWILEPLYSVTGRIGN